MKGSRMKFLILLLIGMSALAMVNAKEMKKPLTGTMKGFIVTQDKKGKDIFTETQEVNPGQTIEYRLEYTNNSEKALKNVKISGPVPKTTVYIAKSAKSDIEVTPEFSIDSGKTYSSEPVKYMKKLPDGTTEEAVATPDMYTHVLWIVPSFSKSSVLNFNYRVEVK